MRRARPFLVGAAVAGALATLSVSQGSSASLRIEDLEAGRTPAGQPWFRMRFSTPYPPPDVTEWYVAVTVNTEAGLYRYSVRRHGDAWERSFVDRDLQPAGDTIESALPDGSFLVVLPVSAAPDDSYVVQTGERGEAGEAADQRGSESKPLRIGLRTEDPFATFGPGTAPADAPAPGVMEPGPTPRRPAPPASPVDDGVPSWALVVGAALGAAVLVLGRARRMLAPPSRLRPPVPPGH